MLIEEQEMMCNKHTQEATQDGGSSKPRKEIYPGRSSQAVYFVERHVTCSCFSLQSSFILDRATACELVLNTSEVNIS